MLSWISSVSNDYLYLPHSLTHLSVTPDPPEVSLRPSDLSLVAVEGETVNVSCSVDSSPPASVVWRHEDTGDVVSSGQHLL